MGKLFKKIILFSLVAAGIFLVADKAQAAIMSVSPQYKEVNYGETFIVDVRLNSEKEIINAVQATITFPADMLEVKDVSQGGSFLTLWPQEPTVDNSAGTISLVGGIPHGSYVVDGKLLSITFYSKSSGGVEIGFDKEFSSVHLNDGQGTQTKLKVMSGIYQITSAALSLITSPTHPSENAWYQNNSPIFRWEANPEAEYSYILDADVEAIPTNQPAKEVGDVAYTNLTDGIYYFILNVRLPSKDWSLVDKRRVMIDQTPPLPFELIIGQDRAVYDGQYFLSFATTDLVSGLDHYEVIEGGKEYSDVQSPYLLKDQSLQEGVSVRAYDKAGNFIESSRGTISASTDQNHDTSTMVIISIVIMVAFIVLVVFLIRLLKRK